MLHAHTHVEEGCKNMEYERRVLTSYNEEFCNFNVYADDDNGKSIS